MYRHDTPTMNHQLLLTLNAGSSSVKFAVYAATRAMPLVAVGQIEGLGAQVRFSVRSTEALTAQTASSRLHETAT
jgi:acetate kinase